MENKLPAQPLGYDAFLGELKERIRTAQVKAALSVNRELILLYWNIGGDIRERQERSGWVAKIVDRLARDLSSAFPESTGFKARNLKYMRALAEVYQDENFVQQVVAQLPWGHHVRLLRARSGTHQRIPTILISCRLARSC